VDDLHDVIATYLRKHNPRYLTRCPAPVPLLDVPRCPYCGKPIAEGDEAIDVELMRQARACVDHYVPF